MNDNEKSVTILDPSGNMYFMDGNGNISVTAPNNMTFTAGKNMNINVGQNMTTSVGANKSNTIGMNNSETVAMNDTQSVGAMKMTSVVGDASMFITGKLTEISDWFFTTKDKNGNKLIDLSSFRSLHRYLDDDFMSIRENKVYETYYRVYCMPDSLGLNGVAEDVGQGVKTVIVFQNRDNFTSMVHELLHSMGVYHTFDNNSKYTFKFRNTDNVMDYTHQIGKKRFTTNIWQWRILNKNI